MAKRIFLLGILSFLNHISTSQCACDRDKLQATADAFLSSAGNSSTSGVKLAANVKIAQNNRLAKSLQDTVYSDISNLAKPFRITALDTTTCNFATMVVPNTGKTGLSLASFRAKVSEGTGEVTEIEIIHAIKNSTSMFNPKALPENPSALWSVPLHSGTGAAPSRDKLVEILETYPNGIQNKNGSNVQTAKSCKRIENGVSIRPACNEMFERLGQPVTNRAYYVDTYTGVSLARFSFARNVNGLWIHEYMKISDEKITEIQAVFIGWPGPFEDVLRS
jgi:hypothetical protein